MGLMDVITAYLYGSIDNDIYMKIPKGIKLPEANNTKPRNMLNQIKTISIWIEAIRTHVVQSPQRVFIKRRVCKQPYMPMHFY